MCAARGFSLIEILVAVAIAGVLFALAVPGAQRYACGGQEAEAREAIAAVVAIEESFRGEHGRYVAVSAACTSQREGECIALRPSEAAHFGVAAEVTRAGYRVTAVGTPGSSMAGTAWRMDQSGQITDLTRTCH